MPRRVPAARIVVSAPETWVDFSRTTPQLLKRMRSNPTLRFYAELAQRSDAIKLVLVDVDPERLAAGFATNLNVVQANVPSGVDLRLAADSAVAQLRAAGLLVGSASSSSLHLPAGEALELRIHERVGRRQVLATQYYLLHQGSLTVLTYSTLPDSARHYRPIFTRSARSLRFL